MVVSWAPSTTSFTPSPGTSPMTGGPQANQAPGTVADHRGVGAAAEAAVASRPARPADEASTATRRGRDRRDRMFGGLLKKKGYRLRRVIGRRRADLKGPACP